MHRAILEACLPGLVALAALFAAAWLVVRLSGARLRPRRLAELHRCQAGGVQSLAFVLTLPAFLMVLMFIVQVSQLMIGVMAVNYAAYAAARSASVWVPAYVDGHLFPEDDPRNKLPAIQQPLTWDGVRASGSAKLEKIFTAAALACAPVCPSRDLGSTNLDALGDTRADESLVAVYQQLAPRSAANPRIPTRLRNKLAYSLQNTQVQIQFRDTPRHRQDATDSPTYNPIGHPVVDYDPNEVGWQDPITVRVTHQFALFPGPGRFLAKVLVRADGRPDEVAPRIRDQGDVYKTTIQASATMTNEGLQSVRPYVHANW